MSMKKITDSVYAAGVLNPQLRVFEYRYADRVRH